MTAALALDEPVALHVRHRAPPHLAPYVEMAVGYDYRMHPPGIHSGLPSQYLTIVVSLHDPVDMIAMPDPRQAPAALGALVGGLHAAPVSIRHDGTQIGIQLGITPRGARMLFGMPPRELAWRVLPLDAVLGPATELVDRLNTLGSWPERFAAIDDVLSRVVRGVRPARAEVSYAFDRLVTSGGRLRVASLAREVGWSRRHLTDQFAKEFGLAPKLMARVLRFERATGMMRSPVRPPLALVAAESGYADQAHMTREWVEFAGSTPMSWLTDEDLPFVQDETAVGAAI